jgi:hypothetical protein
MTGKTFHEVPVYDRWMAPSRVYWIAWLAAAAIVLAIRVLAYDAGDDRFPLAITYMFATGLSLGVLQWYEGHRTLSWLRKHRYAQWKEIRSTPDPHFRLQAWLYEADVAADPELEHFQREHRSLRRLMLTAFCSTAVIVPLLFV